jgi:cell division protein FtsW
MSKSGKILTILTFVLVIFGLVMLSSAGVVEGRNKFGSPYYYLMHQFLYGALPGAALFLLFSRINYKFWRKIALPLLIVITGLLVLVFVPGIGYSFKGAQRWVGFKFLSFQPSEFLKLALIVYLAAWFSRYESRINVGLRSITPFFLVFGFAGLLLLLQPDMGTLILVALIAVSMYFFAGAKLTHFVALILILAVLVGTFSVLEPYRFKRIKTFVVTIIKPEAADIQGSAYHINQALLGIGSGGIFGLGFGQSRQKLFNYLPEPVGDSIFAIIVEELGFVGAIVLLSLFLMLALALISIAKSVHNQFGRLLVLGVMTWITGQTLINISAISGLIPLTGIPLPFISFGSSSLVTILAGLGIAANVSKYS